MTHCCSGGLHRQSSPFQNPSNARGMPQKIQYSIPFSTLSIHPRILAKNQNILAVFVGHSITE